MKLSHFGLLLLAMFLVFTCAMCGNSFDAESEIRDVRDHLATLEEQQEALAANINALYQIAQAQGEAQRERQLLLDAINRRRDDLNREPEKFLDGRGTLTLTQQELPKKRVRRGLETELLKVVTTATGEDMDLRFPNAIFRKEGGLPWKTAAEAGKDIYEVVVRDEYGSVVATPSKLTLLDHKTLLASFDSKPRRIKPTDPQELTLMAKVSEQANMQSLSAALEPGQDNISGAVSSKTSSSGAVAGPVLTIYP